jgi:hypothetical protein
VIVGPFQYKRHRAARQKAADHTENSQIDQRFVLSIQRMEMRRRMILGSRAEKEVESSLVRFLLNGLNGRPESRLARAIACLYLSAPR